MGLVRNLWWAGTLALAACGTSAAPPNKKEPIVITGDFYVVQYSPAPGEALPASVYATFNKPEINRFTLAAITHYNLVCGGITHAAASVNSVNGYSSVTINLPIINGLASGSECTLWLSSGILDTDANPLSGSRSVTYRVP